MHRRDCVRNLETLLVCANRHQQMTMKCVYSMSSFSAAYRGHTVRYHMRALGGLADVKPRKQIICNTRFERKIYRRGCS